MQTMSASDIQQMVNEAKPTSSGDDAAIQQKSYEAISSAADATLKARNADPAKYARQAFPAVNAAWDAASAGAGAGQTYTDAIALSIAAQEKLGISEIKPLPKDAAEFTISRFKDPNLPEAERFSSVTTAIMSTPDPGQRRAIFEQLVDAGLPDTTEGAFEALSRGDEGAARRLMQAAVIDPDKLPGKSPETPASINETIQSTLMDTGQLGDIYYGLSDGTAENFVRAERDTKLMNNAVNIRLRNGEDLETAIAGVSKDLYGDVKVVSGDSRVNAQVLAPSSADPDQIVEGLAAVMPQVKDAVAKALPVPADAPTADGTKAILDATTSAYMENVLAEGYFRNSGDGYVFIDPYTGAAVPDASGQPMIFKLPAVIPPSNKTPGSQDMPMDYGTGGNPLLGTP